MLLLPFKEMLPLLSGLCVGGKGERLLSFGEASRGTLVEYEGA